MSEPVTNDLVMQANERLNNSNAFTGGLIVIPTRNRWDLAINAIQSVLNQPDCDVRLLVSDNSTSRDDISRLSDYCSQLSDNRLIYIRPPQPLSMSHHWDWALQQALNSDSNHFAFLTDRMVFKPHALQGVMDIVEKYPDIILCYMHDKVFDFARPYKVHQNEWTSKVYEVSSTRLLKLSAESVMYDSCVPRMLNCFVPRTLFEAIKRRFGNVFSSISPDWNFAYRVLDIVNSILFYHKAVMVHYALRRGNGEGFHRGIRNTTGEQFKRDLTIPLNLNAPYPEIITVWNGIISEYSSVKKETQSTKFPELNMERYTQALASGIKCIENPKTRRDMEQKLMMRGWNPAHSFTSELALLREMMTPRGVLSKVKSLASPSRFKTFETPEQALEFAVTHLRPIRKAVIWEEALHQGVEVSPIPTQAWTTMVGSQR
jgi:glycosyl transferase family 2